MGEKWSEEEKQLVQELYPHGLREDICAALPGRSWDRIIHCAMAMGVKRHNRKRWTIEDVERLRQLYPTASRQVLMAAFSRRTWENIQHYASVLGIPRQVPKGKRPWQPEEDAVLKECYGVEDVRDIQRRLAHRGSGMIRKRAKQLGLARDRGREKLTDAPISVKAHHQDMVQKYFPRPPLAEKSPWVELLQEGVVAMVQRINAARMDARDLRR